MGAGQQSGMAKSGFQMSLLGGLRWWGEGGWKGRDTLYDTRVWGLTVYPSREKRLSLSKGYVGEG